LSASLVGLSTERRPTRRRFSPGDVLRLLTGILVVAAGLAMALVGRSTAGGLELDVARQVKRLPDRFVDGLLIAIQLLGVMVPLVGFGYLLVRRRFALVVQLIVTGGVAAAVADGLAVQLEDHLLGPELARLAEVRGVFGGSFPSPGFVAGLTALVTFGAPWMTRRWRQASWLAIAIVVLARLTSSVLPFGEVVIALGVGMIVGSAGLLCFGSPNPEPSPDELDQALSAVGIDAPQVVRSHERGVRPAYHVREPDGRTSFVKLRTPEDRDADFLSRLYRAARFRSVGLASPFASLKREVEHEVFLLGMARGAKVRTPVVRAFGTTSSGSAFLVEELVDGRPITDEELARPDQLAAVWAQLGALHRAGIAHLALTTGNILLDHDGAPWLVDFDRAEAAADERQQDRDVADLLVVSALAAGVGPAVGAAIAAMGDAAVAGTLPLLQPLAMAAGVRRRVRREKQLLPDLRRAVQESTGAPEAQLARLERVRPRTIIVIVGSTVAFYSLLPQLGKIGGTAERLRDANYLWLAALLAASLATYVFATVCVLGSVSRALQGLATFRAQVASSFATLLGPGSSGSAALNLRFLERSGISVPEATAAVALNAVSGFIIHAVLLFAFVLWTGRAGAQRFSLPDANLILLALAVLATLVGVALLVRPLRERVLTPALSALRAGLAEVGGVFRSPTRVLALFGGSAALSLAYIAGLAAAVAAFGGDLAFPQVGTAYLAGSAIASLAPTPGGLGAVESALIAGLTGYGLSDGLAVSAVLTFRLATFWLPILPGWILVGWMERHREL
jgi:glycosyltransferase 2 family protein